MYDTSYEPLSTSARPQSDQEMFVSQFIEDCFNRYGIQDFADIPRLVKNYTIGKLSEIQADIDMRKCAIEECLKRAESI